MGYASLTHPTQVLYLIVPSYLQNLPHDPVSTVNRSSTPRVDIHSIVDAASAWGRLESGKLALAVLIENAFPFGQGTELGNSLEALLDELRNEI